MLGWILAVLFFLMALYLLQDWVRHMKCCTETVTAVVAEVEERTQERAFGRKKNYYPVYSFRFDGQDHTVRPKEPSRSNKWTIGAEETLHFDPKDPEYFYVGRNVGDIVWCVIALLLTALMVIIEFYG